MDIAILGAGVGGVTTAIALIRRGFEVSIFERTPAPAQIGAGMVVWPNASFVLRELGLLSSLAACSGRPETMRRISAEGHQLGELDLTAIDRRMGYPSYSILRTDLQSVLLGELSRLGVEVKYSHAVVGIEAEGEGRTRITFQNGEQLTPDIAVGADGRMNSLARQFVHGDNAPVYQGFINWIAAFECDTDVVNEMAMLDVWGIGERFGIVPIALKKVYWAGGAAQPIKDAARTSSNREELISIFRSWPAPIPDVITRTPESSIKKIYVHDHNPIETWHRENVVLLGDSAHAPLPTSGQGACQAMEDAWHIANCLAAHPDSHQRAFADYTSLRRDKTSGIIRAGREFARSLFNLDEEICRLRNERSKVADYVATAEGMAKGWSQGLPIGR